MGDQLLPKVTAASGVSTEIKEGRHSLTQFHYAYQCNSCRNTFYIIRRPLTFSCATAEL